MVSEPPKAVWHLAPMQVDHLPEVMELERAAYPFPWTEGIFRDCLKTGYAAWIVRDPAGVLRGYALLTMAVGEAHVLNLAVDPQCRRQGLGRFLLLHLLTVARAAHCTIVLLEVRRSNKGAIRLYQSAGFRHIGTRRGYYPSHERREDAFVLALDLE